MNKQIILASASPRRKQLLTQAEIDFEVIVETTDESYLADLAIEQIPVYIAEQKAKAVLPKVSNGLIIAADTVVVLNNEIIGKPKDFNNAVQILSMLSGKKHQVITGVYMTDETKSRAFYSITDVYFHPLTLQQIEHYVTHYKPYDKAGAYAIQEWIGAIGIEKIDGDYYNVMGLPINKVVNEINDWG